MNSRTYCLDTSVLVKVLVPEEGSDEANDLLREAISAGGRLIAPAFAWAEVGTVLRKKMRAGHITEDEANTAWERFVELSIDYLNDPYIPTMAWNISLELGLPTLYAASFLAVCDRVREESRNPLEFWTADKELVRSIGSSTRPYVKPFAPSA